jgi:hypothetical protein
MVSDESDQSLGEKVKRDPLNKKAGLRKSSKTGRNCPE